MHVQVQHGAKNSHPCSSLCSYLFLPSQHAPPLPILSGQRKRPPPGDRHIAAAPPPQSRPRGDGGRRRTDRETKPKTLSWAWAGGGGGAVSLFSSSSSSFPTLSSPSQLLQPHPFFFTAWLGVCLVGGCLAGWLAAWLADFHKTDTVRMLM